MYDQFDLSLEPLMQLSSEVLELISKSYIMFSPLAFQTLGFVLLGGVEVHALNVTGLAINTFGGVWYSYAKYKQKKKTPRKIQHDVESHAHK